MEAFTITAEDPALLRWVGLSVEVTAFLEAVVSHGADPNRWFELTARELLRRSKDERDRIA